MDAAQILVIILAVFLAVFLLLGVVLTILLIKVTKQIKFVAASAARTAQNIEKTTIGLSKVSAPLFIARLISKQMNKIKKR